MISGSQTQNGSIPLTKLSASAIKSLRVTGAVNGQGSEGNQCGLNTLDAPAFCGTPATVKFDKKTVAFVNGDIDMASADGNKNGGSLGVCYAAHGSSTLTMVQHLFPEFATPMDSYLAQGVTGAIGGLHGTYDVGLCVAGQSPNTENGQFTMTVLTAETTAGVTSIGS